MANDRAAARGECTLPTYDTAGLLRAALACGKTLTGLLQGGRREESVATSGGEHCGSPFAQWQVRCQARATITRNGQAHVRSAASDPGTGARTVMRQLSGELLGLPLDQVRFELGDSDMPWSPASGGSGLTTSLGTAVHAACRALLQLFLYTVADDERSPLRGCSADDVCVAAGHLHRRDDPSAGESYADILTRHGLDELTADAEATPPSQEHNELALSGPFAAKFVEVRVDEDLGSSASRASPRSWTRVGFSTRRPHAARSSAAPSAGSGRRYSKRPSPIPGPDASPTPRSATT